MSCLPGIDLGTSSVKVVVSAVEGVIKGIGLAEYPTSYAFIGGWLVLRPEARVECKCKEFGKK